MQYDSLSLTDQHEVLTAYLRGIEADHLRAKIEYLSAESMLKKKKKNASENDLQQYTVIKEQYDSIAERMKIAQTELAAITKELEKANKDGEGQ